MFAITQLLFVFSVRLMIESVMKIIHYNVYVLLLMECACLWVAMNFNMQFIAWDLYNFDCLT